MEYDKEAVVFEGRRVSYGQLNERINQNIEMRPSRLSGHKQWGLGTDSAAHGSMLCCEAITGKEYLNLVPPYIR